MFILFPNSLLNFRLKRKAVKVHGLAVRKVFERQNKILHGKLEIWLMSYLPICHSLICCAGQLTNGSPQLAVWFFEDHPKSVAPPLAVRMAGPGTALP